MRLLLVLVLVLVPAMAPAARADFTVATVQRPTPISSYAGHVVWSRYDAALGAFRLMEAHASAAGQVTTALPVAARAVPFDADVGPDANGAPTVVYSRCATEPRLGVAPAGIPVWATGGGCDVYRYTLGAAGEVRDTTASTAAHSEFLPTVWRGRIGFARHYDSGGTYVYVSDGHAKRLPGGHGGAKAVPGPTALDLAGTRLALSWAYAGGSEIRLDTVGGAQRLLERITSGKAARNLLSAFVFSGRVWWVREATDAVNRYERFRISTGAFDHARMPGGRRYTIGIAPQSASSLYWSQERAPSLRDRRGGCEGGSDQPPCAIGGDGSIVF